MLGQTVACVAPLPFSRFAPFGTPPAEAVGETRFRVFCGACFVFLPPEQPGECRVFPPPLKAGEVTESSRSEGAGEGAAWPDGRTHP